MSEDPDRSLIRMGYDDGELMGLPAVARTNRAVIIAISDAIVEIVALGWDRDRDVIIDLERDDGLPAILLRGRPVFEIRFDRLYCDPGVAETDGQRVALTIRGHWLTVIRRPGILLRAWRRAGAAFRNYLR